MNLSFTGFSGYESWSCLLISSYRVLHFEFVHIVCLGRSGVVNVKLYLIFIRYCRPRRWIYDQLIGQQGEEFYLFFHIIIALGRPDPLWLIQVCLILAQLNLQYGLRINSVLELSLARIVLYEKRSGDGV